jgi:iron complex transport system ATP-binding protein
VLVTIDAQAVRVSSAQPLRVLSSAVVGGGLIEAAEILNLHVHKDFDGARPEDDIVRAAARSGVCAPFVGLMTAAETQYARTAVEMLDGLTVAAVASVGLSNVCSAGVTPPATARPPGPPGPGTINLILLVDARLSPSAMVNAVITVTEAKALVLAEWDVRSPDGHPASGTSTDSVVVACTGAGAPLDYAGPATTVGWLAARAVRSAIACICREKCARDGGRVGW